MQQGLFTRRQESHPKRRSALARRQARPRLYVELLEDRSLLSGSPYLPPSHMLSNPNGLLTGPTQGDPLDIAVNYLGTNASAFGLAPADLREAIVTDRYTDADTGITHIYLRQSFNGLEVANANIGVHLNAQGQVISAGGGFVSGLSNQGWGGMPSLPALSALDAVKAASANLNLNPEAAPLPEPQIVSASYDPAQTTVIAAPGVSLDDVTARLHYVPTPDGGVALAWDLVIRTPDGDHWYNLSIDGSCGATVAQTDWVSHASYSAIPLPNESPQDGGFAVISGIEDATASPFGWHDTNGAAGAEFTDTRGNNVDAHLDRDGNNVADASPPRPNGGVALDFSGFTFNPAGAPSTLQNENAAVVNLFVMNNVLHDIHYKYGFTEAAGNFQTNNYGRGGSGSDAVQADAQDNANGGSTNNANFSTPPDGFAPRMQMYEFTLTTPRRDSDLDNGVIIHEYAHGVSNRLTGGPANSNALNALQSGGMGEGWGDFYGLMFAQRSTDLQNDAFGMGTYVLGQPQTGLGIRRYRYSYNMTIDPLTFAYFNGGYPNNEVHNSGEIWASTLWDLNWLLINKYGFDSDLYTGWTAAPGPGHAGNKLALRLVMEAMKLQPANPSFIQARDAIIAADVALNGGADLLEIWTAFARRGLGFSASTANSSSTVVTVAFDLPNLGLTVTGTTPASGAIVTTPPTTFVVDFSDPYDSASVQPGDLTVNGIPATGRTFTDLDTVTFTFGVSPVTSQGLQTMTIAAGAITRDSDNDGVDAFSASFRYDALPLAVVSTFPPVGATVTLPLTTLDVNFNEPVAPGSVSATDLTVNQGSVSGFTLLNSNTTIRFTLSGITTEGTLNASIAAGALTDTFGNPNVAFAGSYTLDFGTVAYPVPLIAKAPLGSLVYDPSITGVIAPAGDTDSFTLAIDPNQVISVTVTPAAGSGLQPTVVLLDPAGNVRATNAAAGPGKSVILQTVPTVGTTTGTYTVRVGGVGGTVGGFTLQVILNALAEAENHDGASNTTFTTAENINGSFISLGGAASRGAVLGRTGPETGGAASLVQDFESGAGGFTINNNTIGTGANAGLWHLSTRRGSQTGHSPVTSFYYGSETGGTYETGARNGGSITSPVISLPAGASQLSFNYVLQTEGNGSYDRAQVQISTNNFATFTTLLTSTSSASLPLSSTWRAATASLAAFAGQNVQIRWIFDTIDSSFNGYEGWYVDDVAIQPPPPPPADYYAFTLAAGDTATVALEALPAGTLSLTLLDPSGAAVALGAGGPTNVDRVIQNFRATTSGLYRALVTASTTVDYNLVVTRNAAFDTEGNDTFATAQDVTGTQGVLGHSGGAGATVVTLNATDSGWYDSNGTHTATNTNYIVGQSGAPRQLRNFFVFNLASVSQVITGATLVLTNGISSRGPGYNSPDASETYTLFDVATSVPTLQAGGSGLTGIFADLGGGTIQGSRTMTAADNFLNVPITLNAAGIAKLNAFRGTQVALGGAVTTLSGGADQVVFAFTGNLTDVKQLILNLAQPEDWYKVTLASDQTALRLDTKTPADGAGQFVNTLNPTIELYNAAGTLVFSGTPGADGRNESLMATGLTAGSTYRIRVRSEGGTQGEYFLGVTPLATPTPTALVDNRNFGFRAYGPGWSLVPSGYAGDSRSHAGGGTGSSYAEWRYGQVFTAGTPYQFYVTWVHDPANASNATYRVMENAAVLHPGISVDQRVSPNSALYNGTLWQALYTYTPTTTGYKVIRIQLSDNANGPVSADAIFDPPLGPQGDAGIASLVAGPAASMPSFTVRGGAPILTPVTPFPGSSQGVVALPDRISVGLTAWAAPSAAFAASSVFADLAAPGRSASLFAENPAIEPASDGVPLRTWLDRAALTPPLSIFGASSFGDRWGDERHTASDSLAGDEVLDAEFVDDYFTAVARTDREESSADDAVLSGALVGDAYFPQALDEPLE